jgi:hypothetical protein
MKYDVFISYSRKDFDEVSALIETIRAEIPALSMWFDITGIESGDEFEEKIISAIDNSSYVLFALSDNALESQWTKDEVIYAKNTGKKIIPILLNGASLKGWFLFKFGRVDCIDFSNPLQKEKLLKNLSDWTGKTRSKKSEQSPVKATLQPAPQLTPQPEPLCPCGSGKLFKDCHGKNSPVPGTSRPVPPVAVQTKATPHRTIYDQSLESEMSIIIKTLNAYKINVACITANVQSNGVMYKITPGSGTKPSAIANLYREIALALGVKVVTATAYADGVALVVSK